MSEVALRKVGSSFVATIPSDLVQQLHLVAGQKLRVDKENGRVILTPLSAELQEVARVHERLLKKYRNAFQKLADG